ncbi:hypothetical protein CDIK_0784 [Cucumispora dikerogammari]|nr:hypothetical protein CDIK_0784 [Cucumispora dikerogammari]
MNSNIISKKVIHNQESNIIDDSYNKKQVEKNKKSKNSLKKDVPSVIISKKAIHNQIPNIIDITSYNKKQVEKNKKSENSLKKDVPSVIIDRYYPNDLHVNINENKKCHYVNKTNENTDDIYCMYTNDNSTINDFLSTNPSLSSETDFMIKHEKFQIHEAPTNNYNLLDWYCFDNKPYYFSDTYDDSERFMFYKLYGDSIASSYLDVYGIHNSYDRKRCYDVHGSVYCYDVYNGCDAYDTDNVFEKIYIIEQNPYGYSHIWNDSDYYFRPEDNKFYKVGKKIIENNILSINKNDISSESSDRPRRCNKDQRSVDLLADIEKNKREFYPSNSYKKTSSLFDQSTISSRDVSVNNISEDLIPEDEYTSSSILSKEPTTVSKRPRTAHIINKRVSKYEGQSNMLLFKKNSSQIYSNSDSDSNLSIERLFHEASSSSSTSCIECSDISIIRDIETSENKWMKDYTSSESGNKRCTDTDDVSDISILDSVPKSSGKLQNLSKIETDKTGHFLSVTKTQLNSNKKTNGKIVKRQHSKSIEPDTNKKTISSESDRMNILITPSETDRKNPSYIYEQKETEHPSSSKKTNNRITGYRRTFNNSLASNVSSRKSGAKDVLSEVSGSLVKFCSRNGKTKRNNKKAFDSNDKVNYKNQLKSKNRSKKGNDQQHVGVGVVPDSSEVSKGTPTLDINTLFNKEKNSLFNINELLKVAFYREYITEDNSDLNVEKTDQRPFQGRQYTILHTDQQSCKGLNSAGTPYMGVKRFEENGFFNIYKIPIWKQKKHTEYIENKILNINNENVTNFREPSGNSKKNDLYKKPKNKTIGCFKVLEDLSEEIDKASNKHSDSIVQPTDQRPFQGRQYTSLHTDQQSCIGLNSEGTPYMGVPKMHRPFDSIKNNDMKWKQDKNGKWFKDKTAVLKSVSLCPTNLTSTKNSPRPADDINTLSPINKEQSDKPNHPPGLFLAQYVDSASDHERS